MGLGLGSWAGVRGIAAIWTLHASACRTGIRHGHAGSRSLLCPRSQPHIVTPCNLGPACPFCSETLLPACPWLHPIYLVARLTHVGPTPSSGCRADGPGCLVCGAGSHDSRSKTPLPENESSHRATPALLCTMGMAEPAPYAMIWATPCTWAGQDWDPSWLDKIPW